MADVRSIAHEVLSRVLYEDAYSAIAINHAVLQHRLNTLDASFLSALVYGVLERKLTLEYIIRRYSSVRIKKIEKNTLLILYLGVFQLIYMDKVPDSAAVNESVKLCKKLRLFKSASFVNAVLRSLVRADKHYQLPDPSDRVQYLSVVYSCPGELVNRFLEQYGDSMTERILSGFIGRPPVTVRVNTLKTTTDSLKNELEAQGIVAERVAFLPDALHLSRTGSLDGITQFKNGLFFVEDAASQLCAEILGAEPGEVICDVCAAPGGKSFYSAIRMGDRGRVCSYDIHPHKLKLISDGARRLGIEHITCDLRDAARDDLPLPECHRLLCDAPCSGLGILRRKPEIRYKSDTNIDFLPELQYSILCACAKNVPNHCIMVYSTCTLNRAENADVISRFLDEHPDFVPEPFDPPAPVVRMIDEPTHCLTLMPGTFHTDGFFIARMRKVGSR